MKSNSIFPFFHFHRRESYIATLKTCAIFSRAYLSLGICRMTEAVNYPPISESIIAFNSLRFQMKSNKGVRHGVDSSHLQDHYMSPSATRRVVMIELALLPDVERTEGVSAPAVNELDKLVHGMHLLSLNSQSLGGIKNNRQSLASYLNFIWPDNMQKLSISPEVGRRSTTLFEPLTSCTVRLRHNEPCSRWRNYEF